MSSSSLLQSAFGSTDVYSILGLSPSPPPSSSSIKKAYHRAALLYHPDKCPVEATAEEKEERTKKFQAVSLCYEVLQDEAKRKRYDASGSLPGDDGLGDEDMGEDFDWVQYFSAIFQKVDASSIGKFESSYKGGEEEATDVIKYYLACGGDGKKMLSCVMCSLPSDVPRWKRDVLGPAIERGDIDDLGFKNFDLAGMEEEDEGEGMDLEDESPASLPQGHKEKETEENESTASNAASSPPKKKAASKSKARAKKSARSAANDAGIQDALGDVAGDLAAQIRGEKNSKQKQASSFLDSLEAKYGGGGKGKGGGGGKKKKGSKKKGAELVDPLDDEAFAKLQASILKKK
ncbi:hypothetical protein TeGR_g6321 [Tetraparma gracilis]|uniref:J domain-containing protein n=1 Tax=Tetraparma gracilis TaxID=2962635 RepID=A0ABQ6M932_9STRA|nr:hypothetical protein TeGR_g6321 [Tetraparma gracilis]